MRASYRVFWEQIQSDKKDLKGSVQNYQFIIDSMNDNKKNTFEVLHKEMCICCLKTDQNNSFQPMSLVISQIYTLCTKLHIFRDKNVPDRICQVCHENLLLSTSFNNQCKKSHDLITSYVLHQVKTEYTESEPHRFSKIKTELLNVPDGWQRTYILPLNVEETLDPIIIEVPPLEGFQSAFKDTTECLTPQESHGTPECDSEKAKTANLKESAKTKQRSKSANKSIGSIVNDSTDIPLPNKISDLGLEIFDLGLDKSRDHDSDSTDTADEEIVTNKYVQKPKFSCTPERDSEKAKTANLEESAETVTVERPSKQRSKSAHKSIISIVKDSTDLPILNQISDIEIFDLGLDESRGHNSDSTDTADEEIVIDKNMQKPKFSCTKCNKRFHYLRDLGDHMNIHTEILDRTCDICEKVFTKKGGLTVHCKIHNNDKQFACDVCGLRFVYNSALRYHKTTHTGEKTYSCEKCGKKFRTSAGLKTHSSTHSTDTPYECKLCGKSYKGSINLYIHQQRCGKSKRHCCDTCGKLLSTQGELRVHMRSHTKEKPFPCPHCDKRYITQSHRAVHMRTHTGERPHVCTLCCKAFLLRRTLAVHMRIHTGELPYECSVCKRCFRQAPVLKTHMKVHKNVEAALHKNNTKHPQVSIREGLINKQKL